jgi:hypothetical protein
VNDLDFALSILERIAEVFDDHRDEEFTGAVIARCVRGCSVKLATDNDLAEEAGNGNA